VPEETNGWWPADPTPADVKRGYYLRELFGQTEFVVLGPWTSKVEDAVLSETFDMLALNYALGFQARDLDFLDGLPVRSIAVLARTISNIEGLYRVPNLQRLQLTSGARELDCDRLPYLRSLSAEWSEITRSIRYVSRDLEELWAGDYAEQDLAPLPELPRLTSLGAKGRVRLETLDGLAEISHNLAKLYVASGTRLQDVTGLAEVSATLVDLDIEDAKKVADWSPAMRCQKLEQLQLSECGKISTLRGIERATGLTRVDLHGSTTITDGDLTYLLRLPRLEDLRLVNRRHYVPSTREVRQVHGITGWL